MPKPKSRYYPAKDLKLLFGKAAYRCSFPGCVNPILANQTTLSEEVGLGHIGHIVAFADEGPRADPAFPTDQLNKYPNLILLCRHHHGLIDEQPMDFPPNLLHEVKASHESWVDEKLSEGMQDVTFPELQVVCNYVVRHHQVVASTSLVAADILEKIEWNSLDECRSYITMGLMQGHTVSDFIAKLAANVDPDFPGTLRAGFLAEYNLMVAAGSSPVEIFLDLWNYAAESGVQPGMERHESWIYRSAALSVISYLFELCDIFEAPDAATD